MRKYIDEEFLEDCGSTSQIYNQNASNMFDISNEQEKYLETVALNFNLDEIEDLMISAVNAFSEGYISDFIQSLDKMTQIFNNSLLKIQYNRIDLSIMGNIICRTRLNDLLIHCLDGHKNQIILNFLHALFLISPSTADFFTPLIPICIRFFMECEDVKRLDELSILICSMVGADTNMEEFSLVEFIKKLSHYPNFYKRKLQFLHKIAKIFPELPNVEQLIMGNIDQNTNIESFPIIIDIFNTLLNDYPTLRSTIKESPLVRKIFQVISKNSACYSHAALKFAIKIFHEDIKPIMYESINTTHLLKLAEDNGEAYIDVMNFFLLCYNEYKNDICTSNQLEALLIGTLESANVYAIQPTIKILMKIFEEKMPTTILFEKIVCFLPKLLDIDNVNVIMECLRLAICVFRTTKMKKHDINIDKESANVILQALSEIRNLYNSEINNLCIIADQQFQEIIKN